MICATTPTGFPSNVGGGCQSKAESEPFRAKARPRIRTDLTKPVGAEGLHGARQENHGESRGEKTQSLHRKPRIEIRPTASSQSRAVTLVREADSAGAGKRHAPWHIMSGRSPARARVPVTTCDHSDGRHFRCGRQVQLADPPIRRRTGSPAESLACAVAEMDDEERARYERLLREEADLVRGIRRVPIPPWEGRLV